MSAKSSKIESMITGPRKVDTVSPTIAPPEESDKPSPKELLVGRVEYKPLDWFQMNPANEIFRKLKTEKDYADLENAIKTTGEITPLLAMPDGLLLKGESRLIVAKRLGWEKLPVTIVADEIPVDEQNKILMLDNVARLQVDENTRDFVYSQIWPDYFLGKKPEGDGGEAAPVPTTTRAEIAAATGLSEKQVQRGAAIAREANQTAQEEGREVTPDDFKQARDKTNQNRREKKEAKKASQPPETEPSQPDGSQTSGLEPDAEWEEPEEHKSAAMEHWLAIRGEVEKELLNGADGSFVDGVNAALDAVEKHIDK